MIEVAALLELLANLTALTAGVAGLAILKKNVLDFFQSALK